MAQKKKEVKKEPKIKKASKFGVELGEKFDTTLKEKRFGV